MILNNDMVDYLYIVAQRFESKKHFFSRMFLKFLTDILLKIKQKSSKKKKKSFGVNDIIQN